MRPNEYEQEQIKAIKAWKAEEPSTISKIFGVVTVPVTWLMEKLIPQAAIRGVIDGANAVAGWLAYTDDILRDANIRDANILEIYELKRANLELCDSLANQVHNWAIGIATVEGGVTGATGIFGLTADIPAIITWAFRTIHKIGLCYGFQPTSEMDNQFILSILSASGANSVAEKSAALTMLKSVEITIAKQTWKAMAEKAAQQQLSKEGAIISVKNLAKQLGINLTKRKALQAIPAVGALIGSSVNGWYIKDVGWAARRAFQKRWLIDNQKIIDI